MSSGWPRRWEEEEEKGREREREMIAKETVEEREDVKQMKLLKRIYYWNEKTKCVRVRLSERKKHKEKMSLK